MTHLPNHEQPSHEQPSHEQPRHAATASSSEMREAFDQALSELALLAVRREELRRDGAPFADRVSVTQRQQELRAQLASLRPAQGSDQPHDGRPERRRFGRRGRAA